jgi:hypothetical protein
LFLTSLGQSKSIEQGRTPCQRLPGLDLDRAIAVLLAERVTKDTLALTVAVQDELIQRVEEAQRLRQRPRRTSTV